MWKGRRQSAAPRRKVILSSTLRELAGDVVYLRTNCNAGDYPTEFETYEEAWNSLHQSLNNVRGKLGERCYAQLLEMTVQAKAHYDDGYALGPAPGIRPPRGAFGSEHIKLGSWLMQDIEQLLKGKGPFAYPDDLYRWKDGKADTRH